MYQASQYFDSVCSRQCRRHLDIHPLFILIIMINKVMISRWFNSGNFPRRFGVFSCCERRYPYVKVCNSAASQKISWEDLITYYAHSKEHFKTNLAEYCGWCTVGQVTSRTNREIRFDVSLCLVYKPTGQGGTKHDQLSITQSDMSNSFSSLKKDK